MGAEDSPTAAANATEKKQPNVARAKRKYKAKMQTVQYVLITIGVVGVILAALLFTYINPAKHPGRILVNNAETVKAINDAELGFKARAMKAYEGWTLAVLRDAFGRANWSKGAPGLPSCKSAKAATAAGSEAEPIPSSYDPRDKYSNCFTEAYHSGKCGTSWAVAVASTFANRLCIKDEEKFNGLRLAPQDLLSCDTTNEGCKGGSPDTAFVWLQQHGIVKERCFPYRGRGPPKIVCSQKCPKEQPVKAKKVCHVKGEEAIQREILAHGPVVGLVSLSDDFILYGGGIYKPREESIVIMDSRRVGATHAIAILGWGEESDGTKYWIIQNNMGVQWGENGSGRIARSGVLLEDFAVTAAPA